MKSDSGSAWQAPEPRGFAEDHAGPLACRINCCFHDGRGNACCNIQPERPHPRAFMKKLLALLVLTLAFVLPAWSEPEAPKNDAEATAAITQLREGLVTGLKNGDIESLLKYLDPQVVVTWQNGEVCKGPAEVREFYKRMMTGPKRIVQEIQSNPEVIGRHVYGDWAVAWGNLHDQLVLSTGTQLNFNSVFTATIARRGDRWLVVALHASVNAFDNPVPSPSSQKLAEWIGAAGLFGGLLFGFMASRIFPRKQPIL
jgi:ketosteroid isomerase-like protein